MFDSPADADTQPTKSSRSDSVQKKHCPGASSALQTRAACQCVVNIPPAQAATLLVYSLASVERLRRRDFAGERCRDAVAAAVGAVGATAASCGHLTDARREHTFRDPLRLREQQPLRPQLQSQAIPVSQRRSRPRKRRLLTYLPPIGPVRKRADRARVACVSHIVVGRHRH